MNSNRISEQQAFDELRDLNARFQARTTELSDLYALLERHDLDLPHLVLVRLVPDGDGSYVGTLLGLEQEWIEFEIDPADEGAGELRFSAPGNQPTGDERYPERLALRFYRELRRPA